MQLILQKEKSFEEIKNEFHCVANIEEEIKKGYEFWKGIMVILEVMNKHKALSQSMFVLFTKANILLKETLYQLHLIQQP